MCPSRDAVPAVVKEGQILAGKYQVERVLGMGGMGVVVAARHVDLDTVVALKFVLPDNLSDRDAVERFTREARAAVSLRSEHAVRIHDTGKLEDGAPFMVMEFLVGKNLADVLEESGPLPAAQAVEYILQVCEAIAEAHASGIIHRDIKPANLFLTMGVARQPLIKVLDFGLAKRLDPLGPSAALTSTTAIMGSPHYMSPEQMRAARDVDRRTDIWSLGVSLYELLSGQMPFRGETMLELSASVMKDWPQPLEVLRPALPPDLCRAVMHCLAKKPEDRFQDVGELARALEAFAPEGVSRRALQRISAVLTGAGPPPIDVAPASALDPLGATRTERDFGTTVQQSSGAVSRRLLVAVIGLAVLGGLVATVGFRWSSPSGAAAAAPKVVANSALPTGEADADAMVPVSVPLSPLVPSASSFTAPGVKPPPASVRPAARAAVPAAPEPAPSGPSLQNHNLDHP